MKKQNETPRLNQDYEAEALKKAAERIPNLNIKLLGLGVNFVLMSNSVYDVIENFFAKSLHISQAKFCILMYLSTESGLTQIEIVRRWNVSDSAVSKCIDGLEKAKLVKRKKSEDDKRNKIITITPEGQQLFDRALVEYEQWLLKKISNLDEGARDKFTLRTLQIRNLFLTKD